MADHANLEYAKLALVGSDQSYFDNASKNQKLHFMKSKDEKLGKRSNIR